MKKYPRLFGLMLLLAGVLVLCKQLQLGPPAHWSWWAVLAPVWVPDMLLVVLSVLVLLAMGIGVRRRKESRA